MPQTTGFSIHNIDNINMDGDDEISEIEPSVDDININDIKIDDINIIQGTFDGIKWLEHQKSDVKLISS